MKKLFAATAISILFFSCEKKNSETVTVKNDSISATDTEAIPAESEIAKNCFIQATDKDTLFLTYEDNLGTLIGKMHYKNFEKDSSLGDVVGSQNGDTLKLTYKFEAEGVKDNLREVWFLKKGGNLIEGIGGLDAATGTKIENPKKMKFDGGHVLKPIDCKNFDKNFVSK